MPTILKWWRRAEQIPILPEPEVPGLPIPSLTQEPAHHTIPILITRLVTHDYQLDLLERAEEDRRDLPSSEAIHNQFSGIRSELSDLSDTIAQNGDEITNLRQEVEAGQRRISELEQEVASMRGDREQLRIVTAQLARMVALLEGMMERLDSADL